MQWVHMSACVHVLVGACVMPGCMPGLLIDLCIQVHYLNTIFPPTMQGPGQTANIDTTRVNSPYELQGTNRLPLYALSLTAILHNNELFIESMTKT